MRRLNRRVVNLARSNYAVSLGVELKFGAWNSKYLCVPRALDNFDPASDEPLVQPAEVVAPDEVLCMNECIHPVVKDGFIKHWKI